MVPFNCPDFVLRPICMGTGICLFWNLSYEGISAATTKICMKLKHFHFASTVIFLCCNKNFMKISVQIMNFAFKFDIWLLTHPNNTYTNFHFSIKNGSDCKIEILQFSVKFCWGWRNPLICWNQQTAKVTQILSSGWFVTKP